MIKFLLFCGYDYYPSIPPGDFEGAFDTLEEAKAAGADWKATHRGSNWTSVCSFDGKGLKQRMQDNDTKRDQGEGGWIG